MCGWYGGPGSWMGMIFMMLFGLLIFAGFILIVLAVARQFLYPRGHPGESPLDILKRRYASGEINREEYERMKQELS